MSDGGPAFPRPVGGRGEDFDAGADGMSLRDYFAGKALPEVLRQEGTSDSGNGALCMYDAGTVARAAYKLADAMLAEREKGATQ